jgi:hypothetical protein
MQQDRELLDVFAEARRTWDDLVTLQPDILAANGRLTSAEISELARRVDAHREVVDMLADALATRADH